MSQIFIGGAYKTEQEVATFNRLLKLNRELTAERAVDRIKREVAQARKQRERLVQPRRPK
jgi:hypothetical protein